MNMKNTIGNIKSGLLNSHQNHADTMLTTIYINMIFTLCLYNPNGLLLPSHLCLLKGALHNDHL